MNTNTKMLVTYTYLDKSYFDINGIQILFRLSKSQCQKIVIENKITNIKYLNRQLFDRDEIVELVNLKNLKDQIALRLTENGNGNEE